jgi:hypothetical protein
VDRFHEYCTRPGIQHAKFEEVKAMTPEDRVRVCMQIVIMLLRTDVSGHVTIPGADFPRFDDSIPTFAKLIEDDENAKLGDETIQTNLRVFEHMLFIAKKTIKDNQLSLKQWAVAKYLKEQMGETAYVELLGTLDFVGDNINRLKELEQIEKCQFARYFIRFSRHVVTQPQ